MVATAAGGQHAYAPRESGPPLDCFAYALLYRLIIIRASVQLIDSESFEPMFPLFIKHDLAYEHFVVSLMCARIYPPPVLRALGKDLA